MISLMSVEGVAAVSSAIRLSMRVTRSRCAAVAASSVACASEKTISAPPLRSEAARSSSCCAYLEEKSLAARQVVTLSPFAESRISINFRNNHAHSG